MPKVVFNGRPVEVHATLTYEEALKMAGGAPGTIMTIVYRGPQRGDTHRAGSLIPGKSVEVEEGMVFSACYTGAA